MKIWVITKRTGIIWVVAIISIVSLILIGNSRVITTGKTLKDLPIYCVKMPNGEKRASVSFDAAWGNEDTEQLIEILDEYNVKATFFVVGGWVDKYPESVKALHDAGHEIMNHSDTHPHMTQISPEKMTEEANQCSEKIEKVTGVKPILFRPPYGDYNDQVVDTMRKSGLYTIQWDVDSLDWKDLSADEICNRVISKTKPGSIILFHNAAKNTPEALPTILEKLNNEGFELVPISELIIKDNFAIDQSGMQYSVEPAPSPNLKNT